MKSDTSLRIVEVGEREWPRAQLWAKAFANESIPRLSKNQTQLFAKHMMEKKQLFLLKNLNKEGLKFNKFYLTLKNLSKSDQVIEFYVDKNILENSKYFEKDKKIILNQSFFNNPEDIILRSIMQVIKRISWKKNYPRGKKVNSLIDSIKFSNKNVKLTLSGCIIEKIQDSVIIYPEKR